MLSTRGQETRSLIRKAAINAVALLLVLYVLADVSVLQIVHGNEVVGIPARHHLVDDDGCNSLISQPGSKSESQASFRRADSHQSDEGCFGGDECLASCSHIVVSYFHFASTSLLEAWNTSLIIANEDTAPKSLPSDIFHPPQFA